jgi:hypothetical protein
MLTQHIIEFFYSKAIIRTYNLTETSNLTASVSRTRVGSIGASLNPNDSSASIALSNSNLTATGTLGTSTPVITRSTLPRTTGKFYFEITMTVEQVLGSTSTAGLANASLGLSGLDLTSSPNAIGTAQFGANSHLYINGANQGSSGLSTTLPITYGFAVDLTNSRLWVNVNNQGFIKNGTLIDITAITPTDWFDISSLGSGLYPAISLGFMDSATSNFSGPFLLPQPSGYSAWSNSIAETSNISINNSRFRSAPSTLTETSSGGISSGIRTRSTNLALIETLFSTALGSRRRPITLSALAETVSMSANGTRIKYITFPTLLETATFSLNATRLRFSAATLTESSNVVIAYTRRRSSQFLLTEKLGGSINGYRSRQLIWLLTETSNLTLIGYVQRWVSDDISVNTMWVRPSQPDITYVTGWDQLGCKYDIGLVWDIGDPTIWVVNTNLTTIWTPKSQ